MPSSPLEQYLLELINETRLDPAKGVARYIASFSPLTATRTNIQDALDYFQVSGPLLQTQFAALTPTAPLAFNEQLGAAAQAHNALMIGADSQSHQLPGELGVGPRITAQGYGFNAAGENIFAYAEDMLYAHAGFMVDWGFGPGGIQTPAGHRTNIMSASYREIGLAVTAETNPATAVGPYVVTEDFGRRSTSGAFVLGVAYQDGDGDGFYSVGEGRGGLSVSVAGTAATSSASGGYSLGTSATGARAITLTGAGLAGAVVVDTTLSNGQNAKLDIVDGTTLQLSISGRISGAVTVVKGLGTVGLTLSTDDASRTLIGTSGGDTLSGGAGNDILQGGSGTDILVGNGGDDILFGGTVGAGAFNQLIGGDGQDTASYAGTSASVYADLRTGASHVGGVFTDYLHTIENLTGGTGDDLLIGTDGVSNLLIGGAGADELYGYGGDDVLVGGAVGAGRVNQLFGGDGQDTAWYAGTTGLVYADLRTNYVYVAGILTDVLSGIEHLSGGQGNDLLIGQDGAGNVLAGGEGADELYGLGGDDLLVGGSVGAGRVNQLFGGDGSDTASYAGTSAAVYADLRSGVGYVAGVFTDYMTGMENLSGGAAGDTLVGDGAANRLAGAGGADVLYGFGGSDTFVFASAADSRLSTGYDVVVDFQAGLDKIDLSAFHVASSALRIDYGPQSTVLYADTDASLAGYELALAFVGPNAVALGDILL